MQKSGFIYSVDYWLLSFLWSPTLVFMILQFYWYVNLFADKQFKFLFYLKYNIKDYGCIRHLSMLMGYKYIKINIILEFSNFTILDQKTKK